MALEGSGHNVASKSIADLIDGILTSPRKWVSLLGLMAALCGLAILVTFAFTRLLSVQTKEIQFGSTGSHIVFKSIDKDNGQDEYLIIVTPQGWQVTAVDVRPADRISFYADGKICVDMSEITEKARLRQQYEQEWAQKKSIKRDDPNEARTPEDSFTDEERKSLILNRPWVGPGGFDLSRYQPSFRSRRSRYLLPDQNAAALVAAIKSGPEEPAREDAFVVGQSKENYQPLRQGLVWLTVNDVQSNDPNNPRLFYNDNIGVFWVRIVVKHGAGK